MTIYTYECYLCQDITQKDKTFQNAVTCSQCREKVNKVGKRLGEGNYRVVYRKDIKKLDRYHKIVAEIIIGRPLKETEVVHHLNLNKGDNRFENLVILEPTTHNKLHKFLEILIAQEIGGTENLTHFTYMVLNTLFSGKYISLNTVAKRKGFTNETLKQKIENEKLANKKKSKGNKDILTVRKVIPRLCETCPAPVSPDTKHKRCKRCYLALVKSKRPPLETLLQEIKEFGYVKTSVRYSVTDNAIRKWIKDYGLDPKKVRKEIKK